MSTYTTGSNESINHLVLASGDTSQHNPADIGSRTVTPALLSSTTWLKGPPFLHDVSLQSSEPQKTYDLVNPGIDSEVCLQVVTSLTHVTRDVVLPQHFERFSKISTLFTAIAHLIHIARSFVHSPKNKCQGWHICHPTEEELLRAKVCIVRSVQNECCTEEPIFHLQAARGNCTPPWTKINFLE